MMSNLRDATRNSLTLNSAVKLMNEKRITASWTQANSCNPAVMPLPHKSTQSYILCNVSPYQQNIGNTSSRVDTNLSNSQMQQMW